MKKNLDLVISALSNAGRSIFKFLKFIDWTLVSSYKALSNLIKQTKRLLVLSKVKQSISNVNETIQKSFPAEKALLNFSILSVFSFATNPYLNQSLYEQHFYSIGLKFFLDLVFLITMTAALVNAYSFIIREFKKFEEKQLLKRHERLLEREQERIQARRRSKPVKSLHVHC